MVIKCLECSHKCGLPFNLAFHYSIYHEGKISKCACGDKTLSGICMKTDCSFKDKSGYDSSFNSSFNSNSNSNSSSNSNSRSNSSINSNSSSNSNARINSNSSINSNSKYNSNSNSSINSNSNSSVSSYSNSNYNSNSNSSVSSNSNSNYNSNSNSNFNTKVLTRNFNKCNSVKPLTDFDESKYTCRNCTSAKVNCLYCPALVRYDGIRAHVKKQHPDVELTRGFSRNLSPRRAITQTGESCSCKYYNFVSFLINNGINIEKVKQNIYLLKSIDSLK